MDEAAHGEVFLGRSDGEAFLGKRQSAANSWLAVPPTALVYVAYFCQVVVLNRVILLVTCHHTFGCVCDHLDSDDLDTASAAAGKMSAWVLSSWNVLSIVSTSWLAAASDVVGRRLVIAVSASLMCVSALGTVLVLELQCSLWWLLPFYTIAGLGGTFTSFNASIFAYVADTSTEAVRPARFAVLESAIFLGGAIGPPTGAALLDHVSQSAPFVMASVAYLGVVAYIVLVMPESVHTARVGALGTVSWLRATKGILANFHPCPKAGGRGVIGAAPWLACFLIFYGAGSEASTLLPLLTKLGNQTDYDMGTTELGLLSSSASPTHPNHALPT